MDKRIAIYPGTFDPITLGHVDVIERASTMFDEIIVVIAINSKKVTLFTEDERLEMAKRSLDHVKNATVIFYRGLSVECAREYNAVAMIRGIRAVSDFEYEFQIALMNRKLEPNVDTVFLAPSEEYTYLNSSIVRELARYGKNAESFVPEYVAEKLIDKYRESDL